MLRFGSPLSRKDDVTLSWVLLDARNFLDEFGAEYFLEFLKLQQCFTVETIKVAFKNLKNAHIKDGLMCPTDYHWLMLDRILYNWLGKEGSEFVSKYFWDTDYDFDLGIAAALVCDKEKEDMLGFDKGALEASLRMQATPDMLKLTPHKEGKRQMK